MILALNKHNPNKGRSILSTSIKKNKLMKPITEQLNTASAIESTINMLNNWGICNDLTDRERNMIRFQLELVAKSAVNDTINTLNQLK